MSANVDGNTEVPTKQKMRKRLSLREMMLPENEKLLHDFLKAFKLIKELPSDNPNSFFAIAGLHGAPYSAKGNTVWCHHANLLFPTWHRFYLLRLEHALRTVCPNEDLALPYWDATSDESLNEGLPAILTQPTVIIDGKTEENPLLDFTLPQKIDVYGEILDKSAGYRTLRYPYCQFQNDYGKNHNKNIQEKFPGDTNGDVSTSSIGDLNNHIISWLNQGPPGSAKTNKKWNSVYNQYAESLKTMTYFYYSHVQKSNEVSVESPHNSMHMAVSGAEMRGDGYDSIDGASGDMGQTDSASFDPVFWFHHCNVDRMFWVWQKRRGYTSTFEIDAPENKVLKPPNNKLNLDTPLTPFQAWNGLPVTSRDCMDIENQMNYTYSIGSLDTESSPSRKAMGSIKVEIEDDAEDVKSDEEENKEKAEKSKPKPKDTAEEEKEKEGDKPEEVKVDTKSEGKDAGTKEGEGEEEEDEEDPAEDIKPNEKKIKLDPEAEAEEAQEVIEPAINPTESISLLTPKGPKVVKAKEEMDPDMKPLSQRVRISNIDKNKYTGSFIIRLSKKVGDEFVRIGQEAVFNRFNRNVCENCHQTPYASVVFILPAEAGSQLPKATDFKVEVVHMDIDSGKLKTDEIKMIVKLGKKGGPVLRVYNVFESDE